MLLVVGIMLAWAHSFVTSEAHTQLAAQRIYFPVKGSPPLTALPRSETVAMSKHAGQQMTTGAQAES